MCTNTHTHVHVHTHMHAQHTHTHTLGRPCTPLHVPPSPPPLLLCPPTRFAAGMRSACLRRVRPSASLPTAMTVYVVYATSRAQRRYRSGGRPGQGINIGTTVLKPIYNFHSVSNPMVLRAGPDKVPGHKAQAQKKNWALSWAQLGSWPGSAGLLARLS